jgi:hypothetical protein
MKLVHYHHMILLPKFVKNNLVFPTKKKKNRDQASMALPRYLFHQFQYQFFTIL